MEFKGKGNHSISELEDICEAHIESIYQSKLRSQETLQALHDSIILLF